jgi:pyruvate dehydrogenase (quinone)
VLVGDRKFETSQNVPEFDYAQYAQSLGLHGVRVESADQIGVAWDQVLSADRPAVLDAVVDPEVPPLPPHISFEQAVAFWKAAYKGDPNRWQMIKQSMKDMAAGWLPKRD